MAVLAFGVLTGALLAIALGVLRAEQVRSTEERAAAISHTIAEQTSRTLQSVDARLQLAALRLDGMTAAGTLDVESGRQMLLAQLQHLPFVRAIWVVDAQGRVLLHTDSHLVGVSVAEREYFRIYRQQPGTEFFLGAPVRSLANKTWMLPVARPMSDAAGAFNGVIVAAVEPPYFEQIWSRSDVGATGLIALYTRRGQLMVRSPAHEGLLGHDFSGLRLFRELVPRAPAGSVVAPGVVDALDRVFAYRVLASHPDLVVTVGIGVSEMLAPWRRFALLVAVFWAGALLIGAGLTLQLHRQGRIRAESEQRFRQLAQAMPQIVFVADAGGRVQFISQRWSDVTGVAVEESLGGRWQDRLHPDDLGSTLRQLAGVLQTAQEFQQEVRLRYRDGAYRWQLLRAVPVLDAAGALVAWYGTATDIDTLKQAQARLVNQAEFLRMAGRLARMGGWRYDTDTEQITWSEEAAAIIGLPPGEQPTMPQVMALFAGESLARAQKAVREGLAYGAPFDIEVEMVTPRGTIWVRSLGQPVRGPDGKVVALQGAQQDITARVKLVEEIRQLNASLEEKVARRTSELAQQEALFRTLAEQAPLPFWTVDPGGAVTFFSRAWYELVGGAPPQWLGLDWQDRLHPDDVDDVRENWRQSRSAGGVYAGTRRIRARDGTWHSTIYRAEPIRDAGGDIVFWVGIDTDVTDILQSEAALRLANEQLEAFAYSVSHDLQSPLQRVLSFSRLLQEELAGLPPGRAQHYLARIRGNAETMSQLIEGLLALAQVSEVDIIRATVNLSDMASEILQRLQQDQPQRRVRWQVEPGLVVQGDVRMMRSVLENLVGNAWKFTARCEDACIEVGGARGEYFVRDNGAGFDMAYADRLFGTFQRLHPSTSRCRRRERCGAQRSCTPYPYSGRIGIR